MKFQALLVLALLALVHPVSAQEQLTDDSVETHLANLFRVDNVTVSFDALRDGNYEKVSRAAQEKVWREMMRYFTASPSEVYKKRAADVLIASGDMSVAIQNELLRRMELGRYEDSSGLTLAMPLDELLKRPWLHEATVEVLSQMVSDGKMPRKTRLELLAALVPWRLNHPMSEELLPEDDLVFALEDLIGDYNERIERARHRETRRVELTLQRDRADVLLTKLAKGRPRTETSTKRRAIRADLSSGRPSAIVTALDALAEGSLRPQTALEELHRFLKSKPEAAYASRATSVLRTRMAEVIGKVDAKVLLRCSRALLDE